MTARTRRTARDLPLPLQMMSVMCVPGGYDRAAFFGRMQKADTLAARVIATPSTDPVWVESSALVVADKDAVAALRTAVASWLQHTGESVVSIDLAIDEVIDEVTYQHREAGFLLGVCVAARLLGASTGGAR